MGAPVSRRRYVLKAIGITTALITGSTGAATARMAVPRGRASGSIDSCVTIDSPGRYELNSDIADAGRTETCIEISANDVHLDGQGHVLGTNHSDCSTGVAVHVTGDRVVVRNLVISGWRIGIQYEDTTGGGVFDTICRSNGDVGIAFHGTNGAAISRTRTAIRGGTGIVLSSADRNTISRNTIRHGCHGIHFSSSDRNTLSWNDVTATTNNGVTIVRSRRNRLETNTVRGAEKGMVLVEAYGNALTSNEITENRDDGAVLRHSGDNVLTHNTACDNGRDGILLVDAEQNRLERNLIQDNADDGIELWHAAENILIRNRVCDNGNGQIRVGVSSSKNEFVRNGTACRVRDGISKRATTSFPP